jgi:hypothetical protein
MIIKFFVVSLLLLSVLLAFSLVALCLRILTDSQPMMIILELLKQIIVPRLIGPLPPM